MLSALNAAYLQHIVISSYIFVFPIIFITLQPPEECCHNSNNKTYQERGKTTGRGDAIASKEQHFFPLAAILENRRETLFHWVGMVSERCHNSKNKTFHGRGKTTGWGDAVASKERHFSPLAATLENTRVTMER
jgi:hypothetical protein